MQLDLTGRVAVITGASSGIGEATARTLAAHGAAVLLLARRTDRIQAVQQELADAGHSALAQDVADAILFMVSRPAHAAINELLVRPATQE